MCYDEMVLQKCTYTKVSIYDYEKDLTMIEQVFLVYPYLKYELNCYRYGNICGNEAFVCY